MNTNILSKRINGKNILVTGGGGSIGSELCFEILKHKPKKIYALTVLKLIYLNWLIKLRNQKKKNEENSFQFWEIARIKTF